ncbi:MAG: hypothetical protein FJZ85_09515 [Chloroflexi bacterium]|nr:hypothetical protein [Chloroflexota bacterium]
MNNYGCCIFDFLLGLALLLPPRVAADVQSETIGDIVICRVAPSQAPTRQKILVVFVLENGAHVGRSITITERIGNADFDQSEAKNINTPYGEQFWYYEWKIKLPAKGNTTVGYRLVPK